MRRIPTPASCRRLAASHRCVCPSGPGIRDDGWAETGTDVPIFYDPLISKLIAWGEDRPQAIARMRRALTEYEVRGIRTSLPFFHWMLRQPAFVEARVPHRVPGRALAAARRTRAFRTLDPSLEEVAAIAARVIDRGERCDLAVRWHWPRPNRTGPTRSASRVGPVLLDRPDRARTWKARARVEGLRG